MDATQLITELLPALNAASTADLTWWTTGDLLASADEAAKRLSRIAAVFAADDAVAAGTGEIPMPAGALAVVHCTANGSTLRASSVRELEALDANWTTTTGTPQRWTQDLGLGSMRLYPAAACVLQRIHHAMPATIQAASPTLVAPSPVAGYLVWAMLGRARQVEGEAQMADVAAHAAERVALFERAAIAIWGPGL